MDEDPGSQLFFLNLSFSEFFARFGMQMGIICVLLMLSAFISACEIAYFSLTRSEVDEFRSRDDSTAKIVTDLLQKPRYLLATMLIFLNLSNVGMILVSSMALKGMSEGFEWNPWMLPFVEIGLITFILLLFGEITPKVYAVQRRTQIVTLTARMVLALRTIFKPLSWVMINSTRFLDSRIPKESEITSKEKIKMAIDLTSAEDSPEEEKQILKGLVDFSSISVKAIMTARVDVRAIDLDTPFKTLVEQINEFGYSRIPVYEESPDSIRGILYVKDLLPLLESKDADPDWRKLLRQPLFVPETKKIDSLLQEFREKRLHIAVVVDEFGGTSGIVTLEDIIEEIFGEINDEFDSEEHIYSQISENEYVFDGKMPLHELFEITGISPEIFEVARGEKDSLAGLILEIYGKIPEKGDDIEFKNYHFHIESVMNNRIRRVKMVLPANIEEHAS